MGKKSFTGNIVLTPDECRTLKNYAVSSFAEKAEKLKYQQKYETAKKDAGVWKKRYEKLLEQAQPYLDAVKLAPERVRAFLNAVLTRGKEKQDIPQERGRKKKRRALLTDKWNGFADLLANLIGNMRRFWILIIFQSRRLVWRKKTHLKNPVTLLN